MTRARNRTLPQARHDARRSPRVRAIKKRIGEIEADLAQNPRQLGLMFGVAGESEATARAAERTEPQPWWAADQAMLEALPKWERNMPKDQAKAMNALAARISAAAVQATQALVSGWAGCDNWAYVRLLVIQAFYAEFAAARGMRSAPAWLGMSEVTEQAIAEMLGHIRALPLAELGPEHFGTVQETLIGYGLVDGKVEPSDGRRKAGAHFTPAALAQHVATRTLEPLLRMVPPKKTLDLRLCDPAVGAGVFLIAIVRALGPRVLAAGLAADLDEAKRLVAIHCCYGVDKAMSAVLAARLALTLECRADRMPGNWLDDNVKHGDALVGLNLDQIERFYWKDGAPLPWMKPLIERAKAQGVSARHAHMAELTNRARQA